MLNTMFLKHIYWRLVPYRVRDYVAFLPMRRYRQEILEEVEQKRRANPEGGGARGIT